jgi:hypothetical protein
MTYKFRTKLRKLKCASKNVNGIVVFYYAITWTEECGPGVLRLKHVRRETLRQKCVDCLNQGFSSHVSRQTLGEPYSPRVMYDAVFFGSCLPVYTALFVSRPQTWSFPQWELHILFILILTPRVMMYPGILKIGVASREPTDILCYVDLHLELYE